MASEGYYTKFSNYVFDYIMPELSPAAFKVLMFVIRRTLGWRKGSDEISYTQFMDGTGLGSEHTIKKAIDELDSRGYIVITREHGVSNLYSINTEVLSVTTTVESAEVTTAHNAEGDGGTPAQSADTKDSSRKTSSSGVTEQEGFVVLQYLDLDEFPSDFGSMIRIVRKLNREFPNVSPSVVLDRVTTALEKSPETVRSPYGFLRYHYQQEEKSRAKSLDEEYRDIEFID